MEKVKQEYMCVNPDCKMYCKIQILEVNKDIVFDNFIFVYCPFCNGILERI